MNCNPHQCQCPYCRHPISDDTVMLRVPDLSPDDSAYSASLDDNYYYSAPVSKIQQRRLRPVCCRTFSQHPTLCSRVASFTKATVLGVYKTLNLGIRQACHPTDCCPDFSVQGPTSRQRHHYMRRRINWIDQPPPPPIYNFNDDKQSSTGSCSSITTENYATQPPVLLPPQSTNLHRPPIRFTVTNGMVTGYPAPHICDQTNTTATVTAPQTANPPYFIPSPRLIGYTDNTHWENASPQDVRSYPPVQFGGRRYVYAAKNHPSPHPIPIATSSMAPPQYDSQTQQQPSATQPEAQIHFPPPPADMTTSHNNNAAASPQSPEPGQPDSSSREEWNGKIKLLMEQEGPLHIHTLILPAGMSPEDPRLQSCKVVRRNTYYSDAPKFPKEHFMGTIDGGSFSPNTGATSYDVSEATQGDPYSK